MREAAPPRFFARRRAWLGILVDGAGLAGLTAVLLPLREHVSLASVTLLFLVPVVAASVTGGVWPGLIGAVVADLLVNFFFVVPYHTLAVASTGNAIVLVVYVLVAATVAVAVDVAARQRASAAARLRENQRLADQAGRARELAEIDRLRAALLDAVGHDLRSPLASIKAAISGLRQPDLDLDAADQADLLSTVEVSTDRLIALVENLLSLSRLQAGVLSADPRPVALDAVVAEAVLHVAQHARVIVDVPDDLPLARADPGLLERAVANLVTNALTASPPDQPVRVAGDARAGALRLRVIDHGPGLPEADRERVFAPFQRLDDHSGTGLGLGLAIARGFTEAMAGTLVPSDTPGGGLTMTITIPAA